MTEIELIEKAAVKVGMKSLLNHGAASCVYSEGCNGVTQAHLVAFAREVALHCVAALSAAPGVQAPDEGQSNCDGVAESSSKERNGNADWTKAGTGVNSPTSPGLISRKAYTGSVGSNPTAVAPPTVDWLGLALDLEAQARRVESQTVERAMLAAAHGLRLMGTPGVAPSDGGQQR